MLNIENKFNFLDQALTKTRDHIEYNFSQICREAEIIFDLDNQISRINSWRDQCIVHLENCQQKTFEQLKNNFADFKMIYLNKQQDDKIVVLTFFIHQLARLNYKNELKIFQKLKYYHIYTYLCQIKSKKDKLILDMNKFLKVDDYSEQIILFDAHSKKLKSINVTAGYGCYKTVVYNKEIFLVLSKHNWTKTYIYVLSHEFRVLKKKFITNNFFVQFTQGIFFFQDEKTTNLIICNLELEQLQEIKLELELHLIYMNILNVNNRIVLNCFSKNEIQILTKDKLELVKSISTKEYSRTWIYVDFSSNIFLTMYKSEKKCYCVVCMDVDGNFIFKQDELFAQADDYFFDDNYLYVYTGSNLMATIF
jgi:hypothetical protein